MITEAQLIDLLQEYRQYSPFSEEARQIQAQIITHLSSSYWWRASYMIELFPQKVRETDGSLQEKLKAKFETQVNRDLTPKQLADFLLKEAVLLKKQYEKKLITDSVINALARETKNAPVKTFQRIKAQQRLIQAMNIKDSYKKTGLAGNLIISPQDYNKAFLEAKNESIRKVLDNIEEYDETKDFMALVNYWIPYKFKDAARKILGIKKSQAEKEEKDRIIIFPANPNSKLVRKSLSKKAIEAEKKCASHSKTVELRDIITEDPQFKKLVRKDKQYTFGDILVSRFWEGKTYENLVQEWDIPKRTIQSCYDRELQRLKPYLKELLQD